MPHQAPISELQEIAQAQYKRKDFVQALETLNSAINSTIRPTASLLDNRAAVHEKLNDSNAALKDARSMIKLHENDAAGYLRAGKVLQKMDKHNVALEIYKRGIEKCKDKVDILRKMSDRLKRSLDPPKTMDPFTQLPIELVEMILAYLSFRQTVNCVRVSKKWKTFISSLPNLWHHLDLTESKKFVPNTFISSCINRSRHHMSVATLNRLAKPETAISAITKSCHHLHTLNMYSSFYPKSFIQDIACATRLAHLTTGQTASLELAEIIQILTLCRGLKTLDCRAIVTRASAGPAAWTHDLPNLETLNLVHDDTQSTSADLDCRAMITRLPGLKKLVLDGWIVDIERTGVDFRGLTKLSHLELISMGPGPFYLPPTLEVLFLPVQCRIEKWMLPPFDLSKENGLFLPNIKRLTCATFYDAALLLSMPASDETTLDASVTSRPSRLRYLHLSAVFGEDTAYIRRLNYSRIEDLEELHIQTTRYVDDIWVPVITAKMSKVAYVDVSRSDMTGVGLKALVEGLPKLTRIDATGCQSLGSDAAEWARKKGIRVANMMDDPKSSGRKVRHG